MIRLLQFELKKAAGKRLFWGLLLLAFALNIILLWWVNKGDIYTPGLNDYKAVYNELRPLDDTGRLQTLQKEKSMLEAIRQKEQLEIDRAVSPNSPAVKSEEEQYAVVSRKYKDILDQKQDYRQAERKLQVVDEALSGITAVTGYRTGMYKVLGTTPKGTRSTVLCKLAISGMISVLLFVCAYLPDFILIGKAYGFSGLSAPLSSLPSFEDFYGFSILCYGALLFGTRLIACLCVASMILALSFLIRNSGYAALTALCFFGGPPLLHTTGVHLLDKASVIPLLTANIYYLGGQSAAVSVMQLSIGGILAVLSLLVLFRRFGKRAPSVICSICQSVGKHF